MALVIKLLRPGILRKSQLLLTPIQLLQGELRPSNSRATLLLPCKVYLLSQWNRTIPKGLTTRGLKVAKYSALDSKVDEGWGKKALNSSLQCKHSLKIRENSNKRIAMLWVRIEFSVKAIRTQSMSYQKYFPRPFTLATFTLQTRLIVMRPRNSKFQRCQQPSYHSVRVLNIPNRQRKGREIPLCLITTTVLISTLQCPRQPKTTQTLSKSHLSKSTRNSQSH